MRGIFYTGLKAPTKLTAGENVLIAPQFQHGERIWNVWLRLKDVAP